MTIQLILGAGLALCVVYAWSQRRKSWLVSHLIALSGLAGIYFVAFPEHSTWIAHRLGVGRGADLVIYCWIVISLALSLNLQFKILRLQAAITELTRELALREPRRPEGGERPADASAPRHWISEAGRTMAREESR